MNKKEAAFVFVFCVVSLFIFKNFPTQNIVQVIIAMVLFFAIIPILFNKYILKRNLQDMGVRLGEPKKGLMWGLGSIFLALLLFALIFKYADLLNSYPLPKSARDSFSTFLLYESTVVFGMVFIFELFFRGFLMFGFLKIMGKWSIVFQAIFFLGLVVALNGSIVSFLLFLVFAPFAGWIALKSQSILYSGIAQFIFIVVLDSIVIHTLR